jgi:quinol monooxygenase YgiN
MFASFVGLIGLSGCAFNTPFAYQQSATEVSATDTYTVVVTQAVLPGGWNREFWDRVDKIDTQLKQSEGMIGFSKRVSLTGDTAWTMSVWRDEEALDAFKFAGPHAQAIGRASDLLVDMAFARFDLSASDTPPSWDQALKALEEQGSAY